ncbi:uncharacterized protein RJT20DRAFT_153892 [Scheffersomyces xylosifermentans]|uniref:uncharacterized protein n=1 Tax=Scheffersomyces xylosifermentans TaxID=1304137 RepID=UPI00315D29CB
MAFTSIKSIEHILKQYKSDLDELGIPSLVEFATSPKDSIAFPRSPYVNKFKLEQISSNLIDLQAQLSQNATNNRSYADCSQSINSLISDTLDEKKYVNAKLIELFDAQNQATIAKDDTVTDETNEESKDAVLSKKHIKEEEEDLPSLRQRLLSGGKHTHLLDEKDHDKLNDYHESIQEDIIHELSELTSSLKNSAYTLSQKILSDDLSILNETNENMIRNSNLFKVIDKNLNSYLENKTGGKISLFFLIKLTVGLVISFLVMILLIKIIPQIG